jgi:hypothetical protein
MSAGRYVSSAPQLVLAPAVNQATESERPSYRKLTEGVQRGLRYLVVAGEFDARHELRNPDGSRVETGIKNDELRAACEWLRYQLEKKESA